MKLVWDRRNFVLGIIWTLLLIPALIWWKESLPFLMLCSVYANIASSFSADEARRARKGSSGGPQIIVLVFIPEGPEKQTGNME